MWTPQVNDISAIIASAERYLQGRGSRIEEILVSPKLVARGYTYIIEHNGKYFFVMNAYDFDAVLAASPDFKDEVYGIPVTENEEKLKGVMLGLFVGSALAKGTYK